jgi:ABC-type sugar transport system permease subunit
MPGAPPYVVWTIGLLFIVLALAIVRSIIWIALATYQDAQGRGAPAVFWLIATLLGGWVTAVIWMLVRERYDEAIPVVGATGLEEPADRRRV